jgi:hypothetical protein
LTESGIDDLESRVAQYSSDDPEAAIVPIQADLGKKHSDRTVINH